jgi:TATA-box binding protein (TBP) (component of TFIID and TFIIIB)
MVYPLQNKAKKAKTPELKLLYAARAKRAKAAIHAANQRAPKQYITATDSQFKSGQNVVAGGTTVASNEIIAYTYVRRVSHDLDIDLRIYNIQTQNIVFSADLGYQLNPEWIMQEGELQGWQVFYNPEEFIGLTWVTNDEQGIKVVFVVFSTGKVVATGIKSFEHRSIAEKRMHDLIGPFRKGNEPASFDHTRKHTRDAATLGEIKSEFATQQRQSGVAKQHVTVSKDNAAKRNFKKLTHEVKDMMKTLAELFVAAPEEDERVLFQQFLEAEI